MNIVPTKEQTEIEKAVKFLVRHIGKECRNKKPLILHSLKAGFKAQELKLSQAAVLAGFLHDLPEDTNCKLSEIKKEFGQEAARLVYALTQYKIKDYKLRWRKLLVKIKKAGKEAMVLKVIDVMDNLTFLPLVKNKTALEESFWKIDFTIQQLKPFINKTKIFQELKRNSEKLLKIK
ncbi:MAG: HD domain-containing protein [Patescibacteria group bacterium]|nr:HD domain-containing protein [Patescibacteria group bacterium]